MEVDIWCIGDLNYFVAVLNSLATICQSGLFQDLFKVGLVLAVVAMGMQAIFMENMQGGLPLGRFVVAWALYNFMFVATANVWVYDAYTLKTMQVNNVPYGVAIAGSITSKVAHEITATLEQAFSTPTMLNDGFAAPLQTLLKVHKLEQGLGQLKNGNVQKTLEEYVQKCTYIGINSGQISLQNLYYQENPWQAIKFTSDAYTTNTYLDGDPSPGGTARTCTDAWNFIDSYLLSGFWDDWQGYLKSVFCDSNAVAGISLGDPTGNTIACDPQQQVADSLNAMVTISQNAQYFMLASVIKPALENGQIMANNEFGNTAQSIIIGQAREQRNAQWLAESSLFANIIRPLMAFFEGFLYAVTPLMALLVAFVPSGIGLIFKFFQMFIWIQMWMPVLAILNHYMQVIMQQKLSSLVVDGLIPLTSIQGQEIGFSNMHDWLSTASYLASSTPAISLALIYGGAITMTHLAGRLQHGQHIEPQIAKPDVVRPGAVAGMQPLQTGGDIYGSRATGYEGIDRKASFSHVMSQEVDSTKREMASAQQTFGEGILHASARGNQGILGQSNELSSSSGLSASSREGFASATVYGAGYGNRSGLSQTDSQKIIGALNASVAAGEGMAGTSARLEQAFGSVIGQQHARNIQTDLKLDDNKTLQAGIEEKLTRDFASRQTRQFQDVLRQDDIKNLENSAKKIEQSQMAYTQADRMAQQEGMRQEIPYQAIITSMKRDRVSAVALRKEDLAKHGGALLPSDRVSKEAGLHIRNNPGATKEDAALWGSVSTLYENTLRPAETRADKMIQDASRHMLMKYMRMAAVGDPNKFKGIIDGGKVQGAGDHAKEASVGLKGPGNVSGGLRERKGQLLPVQSEKDVRNWGEGRVAKVRGLQEEHRLKAPRDQYKKGIDDTMREFEVKKSGSQSMRETADGLWRSLKTSFGTGIPASLASLKKMNPNEFKRVWDQEYEKIWQGQFQKAKTLGHDDNMSWLYATAATHGLSIAAKEHAGIDLGVPKNLEAGRTRAIEARSQILQGRGYTPDEARELAEKEVFLVEKSGQTGMDNWGERVISGEKSFKQAEDAGKLMGPTSNAPGAALSYFMAEVQQHGSRDSRFTEEWPDKSCGGFATAAMNRAFQAAGSNYRLPLSNAGTQIPAELSEKFGVPLVQGNFTVDKLKAMGEGTVIAGHKPAGSKWPTHAEVLMRNPANNELQVASFGPGEPRWKKINEAYVGHLNRGRFEAANPFAGRSAGTAEAGPAAPPERQEHASSPAKAQEAGKKGAGRKAKNKKNPRIM